MQVLIKFLVLFITIMKNDGLRIECKFELTNYWPKMGRPLYTCYSTKLSDFENSSIVSAEGIHLSGKHTSDVEAVSLQTCCLQTVPGNLHEVFPKAVVIRIANTNLTSISNQDFKFFPNLLLFALHSSPGIDSLPSNLFYYNKKLIYLAITGMPNLRHIGKDMINLPQLGDADFIVNGCVNQDARSRDAVIKFNQNLHIHCPPKIDYCPVPCSDESSKLSEKVWRALSDQLKLIEEQGKKIDSQQKLISQQQQTIEDLQATNKDLIQRINEVEKKVLELRVNP
jgi:hypothetical protein